VLGGFHDGSFFNFRKRLSTVDAKTPKAAPNFSQLFSAASHSSARTDCGKSNRKNAVAMNNPQRCKFSIHTNDFPLLFCNDGQCLPADCFHREFPSFVDWVDALGQTDDHLEIFARSLRRSLGWRRSPALRRSAPPSEK
jgi:hypothetical protein